MHEWSIVQALLARVDEEAQRRRASRVHRLRVRLGTLSGVEPALLASAYDVFRAGTLCAGAPLEIVAGEARWACDRCGEDGGGGALRCARCGAPARLAAGDEILLERIEMEVP